jgi:signal transduction histidine kinase
VPSAATRARPRRVDLADGDEARTVLTVTLTVIPARTAWTRLTDWRATRLGGVVWYLVEVGVVIGAYYLAARFGLELLYPDGPVAAMWPPVGVGIAALYFFGLRLWPAIVIGDLLPGVADYQQPLGTVFGQTLGNTVAVVVAAALLRRLTHGRAGLERVVDVLALVVCGVVAAGVSALFGPPALYLGDVIDRQQLDDSMRRWFLSDVSGALVVTPIFLAWAGSRVVRPSRRFLLESLAVLTILILVVEVPAQQDVPYVVFPVLIWAALRLGPRGAAAAVLVVASLTILNTAQNEGPFVRESITDQLLATQLFIAVAALTSLFLAAVTAERRRAGEELRRNEESVRLLANEQAALRRVATLVASEADPQALFEKVTEEAGILLGAHNAAVLRYGDDGFATLLSAWSVPEREHIPAGAIVALDGDTVAARVYRTGETQRASYEDLDDPLARMQRSFGYRSAVGAPVNLGGRLWGVIVAATADPEPLPGEAETRLCDFAELVSQALANADAREKLAASRARIVEAGDAERRRLERNLHDGAQQRLVALALHLRLVQSALEDDPERGRALLADANAQLYEALEELRELGRGIHPAILTDRGLGPAVEALVARAPFPIELTDVPDERLPEPVEAAAYYVVAEAVTNAAKYAQASNVSVSIRRLDGRAVVQVADDGIGGADSGQGSGLRGLADRLEALDGRLRVESPPNGGTRIEAEIPLRSRA